MQLSSRILTALAVLILAVAVVAVRAGSPGTVEAATGTIDVLNVGTCYTTNSDVFAVGACNDGDVDWTTTMTPRHWRVDTTLLVEMRNYQGRQRFCYLRHRPQNVGRRTSRHRQECRCYQDQHRRRRKRQAHREDLCSRCSSLRG